MKYLEFFFFFFLHVTICTQTQVIAPASHLIPLGNVLASIKGKEKSLGSKGEIWTASQGWKSFSNFARLRQSEITD